MTNYANIYILEDPRRKCYKNIMSICNEIINSTGIRINNWYDYNNNTILQCLNKKKMKHCDAAIELCYSNKTLFILLELTSLIHYCDEEDKLNKTRDFFYIKQVINNSTKIVPIVYYTRKSGKSAGEKSIRLGKNKIIYMSNRENIIQVLSDYNLI